MIWYEEHIPCPELQPYIKLYYLLDVKGVEDATDIQRVTPDGSYELNFLIDTPLYRTNNNGEKTLLPDNHIVSRFQHIHFLAGIESVKIFGIRFQPLGLQKLTGVKCAEIADEIIEPEYIFKKEYNYLKDSISSGIDIWDYIHYTEAYFKKTLCLNVSCDNVDIVNDIAATIIKEKGKLDLRKLYTQYSIGERRIQQLFTEATGVSPKYYSRLIRYQSVLRDMKALNYSTLTNLAYKNNYTDQSHFIRDFKCFSGLSPSRFIKERHMLNDMISATRFL